MTKILESTSLSIKNIREEGGISMTKILESTALSIEKYKRVRRYR